MTTPVFDSPDAARRRRSAKWRTHPADVLPMFVAEMDVALAPPVQRVLADAVAGSDTGYAMAVPALGEALAGFAERRWGWTIDPGRVAPVPDVGVGMVEVLRLLGAAGRPVVFSPPVYSPFWNWVAEVGGQAVEVPLTDDGSWRLDLPALELAFAQRPAAYLLCNPHNPVGWVPGPAELAALVELATRYGVPLVSDEIHAPLTLPGETVTPLLTVPGAADVALAVVSASKAFNLAGLKCAAVVSGSAPMQAVLERMPPDVRWRPGHLGVLASIAAFTDADAWLDALRGALADRFDVLGHLLAEQLPQVRWRRPQATFLAWLDCREVGEGDAPFQQFLDRGRVAVEPGLKFGAPGSGFVRLNVGTSPELLTEGVARMATALR
ncbi:cystathione beta-lyase [Modestobacter sp. DSM 44400]|uniref:MalY/PatB family protein n=1 Tax=Modestobacter sp. DSM 44400 TaxID=1550230 RepID=UPI00089A0B9A|nr:aminotransferase class I/II-fold pyridoxal phosphate-dependent enzyme [Modestobacter sp. DSM 44400]SDY47084.1 cystathione beta-lyase [Modestobacter sp. DSM 44400]